MRALFSLVALMGVAFIVMKLAGTQLQALAPGPAMAGSAPAHSAARSAAQQAAARLQHALQQGAALRAEDAASR